MSECAYVIQVLAELYLQGRFLGASTFLLQAFCHSLASICLFPLQVVCVSKLKQNVLRNIQERIWDSY